MKVLGIFRGFPGLGRVVAGVTLIEELRDLYNCEIRAISYLQGNKYLAQKGFTKLRDASPMDYCSIGLLPTNKMGVFIHSTIKNFEPDLIIVDGEPLIIQSIKISHPNSKIVALLNPSDVDNPANDAEAMAYFNALYSLSDLTIVHGLRNIVDHYHHTNIICIPTIIRDEITSLNCEQGKNIYCILGGGTENSSQEFIDTSTKIAKLCINTASEFSNIKIHILCSCSVIASELTLLASPSNVIIHDELLTPNDIYLDAALIITRSGRNTLSEVAYLGIPTISFVSGDCYRIQEQRQNLKNLAYNNITEAGPMTTATELGEKIKHMISKRQMVNNRFIRGNELALNAIINLLYNNK